MSPAMQGLCVLIFASLLSVQALIMPISKPDGSLDVPSLLNHITLLEQKIDDKASQSEISNLESELKTARLEQKVTQTKLDRAMEDLEDLTAKDNSMNTELAVLQSQIESGNSQCTCGSSGTSGSQPAQDLSGLRTDVSTIMNQIVQLQSLNNNMTATSQGTLQGSSVYTRWGRTSCPWGNMVYKGYAAGSYWSQRGGSASMLCLPEDPFYSYNSFGVHDNQASEIWGTEFEAVYNDMPFNSLSYDDMPCAVCESKEATSVMIPARSQCYPGWTKEYSGYLMGGYKDHSSVDYICVDSSSEAIPGSGKVTRGRLIYPVESKCGALACPPYVDGKFLTCVVCSKQAK